MEQIGIERHLCDTQISSVMEELQKNIRRINNSGEREKTRQGGRDRSTHCHPPGHGGVVAIHQKPGLVAVSCNGEENAM